MKLALAVVVMLALAIGAIAQTPDPAIDKALLGAPAQMKAGATVMSTAAAANATGTVIFRIWTSLSESSRQEYRRF